MYMYIWINFVLLFFLQSREVRELCQRCAKVTKSKLAYPMCCENRDDARAWCKDLLFIG